MDIDFEDMSLAAAPSQIEDIAGLVNRLARQQDEVAAMELALKEQKDILRKMAEVDVPEAMDAAGISEFKLTDGRKLKVKDIVRASIPKDNQQQAFAFLESAGHGDLIKCELDFSLGRDSKELAQEILKDIAEIHHVEGSIKESVNAQTLSAWCREQIAEGVTFPEETAKLLGLFRGRAAEFTKR